MYTRSRTLGYTQIASATNSDDESREDDDESVLTLVSTYLPKDQRRNKKSVDEAPALRRPPVSAERTEDDGESLIQLEANDATLGGPSRAREGAAASSSSGLPGEPLVRVVDRRQAKRFRTAPPRELERAHRYPYTERATDDDELDFAVAFARRRAEFETLLTQLPWYRMCTMIAAYAGLDIRDLVNLPADPPVRSLMPPPPVYTGATSPLNKQVEALRDDSPSVAVRALFDDDDDDDDDDDETDEEQLQRHKPPSPPAGPTTPSKRSTRQPDRPRRFRPSDYMSSRTNAPMTVVSGTLEQVEEARRKLQAQYRTALDTNAGAETFRALRERKRAFDEWAALERVVQPRARSVGEWLRDALTTGQVSERPMSAQSKALALTMVHQRFPRELGAATVDAFERSSSDAATLFALIAASVASRGFFEGGRRPLRASDYRTYSDGVQYAMTQLRWAHIERGRVVMDMRALSRHRDEAAARTPWCRQSTRYGSTSGTFGGGGSSFGATVKDALLSTPGFAPLMGLDAKRSPYSGRGVFR